MRSLVRSVSGRNMAKASAFHTHPHLSSASMGKSALKVVKPAHSSSSVINTCRKVKRRSALSSAIAQPATARPAQICDTGTLLSR